MLNPPHILVCDDEAHIRAIIIHKLTASGYTIRECRTGREGLDAVTAGFVPDLIITDFQMPALSGLEMCQALKLHTPTSATPALMLTARGYTITDEQLGATNIREVISKPFGVKLLLDRVVGIIGLPRAAA